MRRERKKKGVDLISCVYADAIGQLRGRFKSIESAFEIAVPNAQFTACKRHWLTAASDINDRKRGWGM